MGQNIDNTYKNLKLEFHILQSFPVTCLNRDDVGAPKTALIGGTTRARVSSQCWKRQVRMTMHDLGVNTGVRTKFVNKLISDKCLEYGATEDQAKACSECFCNLLNPKKNSGESKKKGKDATPENEAEEKSSKSDTLIFISHKEAGAFAAVCKEKSFDVNEIKKLKLKDVGVVCGAKNMDAVDIALFGRMLANAADLNVEAAASFSHAISTHEVNNEVDFFTALDDMPEQAGSAHMGSLEFNSATYYRYISLDLGQLYSNLAGQNMKEAVDGFIKALFIAVPEARQTTQSGASPWEFARIYIRKGQRLQAPFETAVKRDKAGGYLEASKKAMCDYLDQKEKMFGSLFKLEQKGKINFPDSEISDIDKLIDMINDVCKL